MDGGGVGEDQRRALGEAAVFGQAVEALRLDGDLARKAAVADHAHHAIADLPVGDTLTQRLDHARDLATGCKRALRLELVFVLNDQNVGIVDRAGLHRDQHLPLGRYGIGRFRQL